MLGFGSKVSHIGLFIVFGMALIFKYIGWLDWISSIVLATIGIIAVMNWFRKEEVAAG
jgi:hypothetical protein